MQEKPKIHKFIFEDFNKIRHALRNLREKGEDEMEGFIRTIVACGTDIEESAITKMDSEVVFDYFIEILEVNRNFFVKYAKDLQGKIDSVFSFASQMEISTPPSQATE